MLWPVCRFPTVSWTLAFFLSASNVIQFDHFTTQDVLADLVNALQKVFKDQGNKTVAYELDEEALIRILKEPKNALVKQYQKLFDFENVKLRFTEGALMAIAKEAIKRKSGARGLRAILENIMLDVMYEIPSQPNVSECIISEEVVLRREGPILLYVKGAEVA